MSEKIVKFACPYCAGESDSLDALKTHVQKAHPPVWGRELYPPPQGAGFIEVDDMKCVGCGLCAEACSMQHYGVINKDYSRIFVRKFLLPIPKAIAVTCAQCQPEERPCQKACPVAPPAIYYDDKTHHMVVNADTCTGCQSCQDACDSEAIQFNSDVSEAPLVCDLCDVKNTGERDPQCSKICPTTAIIYHNREERIRQIRDTFRRSSDKKADMIAKRLYPLTRDSIAFPPWQK
jgi:Fe-S-cluster-containing hydrogenase component 2